MKNIDNLVCQSLKNLSPYTPIGPPDQIAKRLNLPEKQIIKLDANENHFGIAPEIINELAKGKYFHIYPDPAQVSLRNSIADYVGSNPEMIVAGTGADELIDLTCRLFLEEGDQVLNFSPSFSDYPHVIKLNKGKIVDMEREKDFSLNLKKIKEINLEKIKIVILCSPNNPSGNILEEDVLDYFLQQNLIVMVDEAYFEFSKKTYYPKLKDFNNLIVLRTFSKCFALAGLRVGYGIMSEDIAQKMMRIKPPYSVNVAAEIALKYCLKNLPFYQNQIETIIKTRNWTIEELSKFDCFQVFPSSSNFILCQVKDIQAKSIHQELEKVGILIRYFDTPLLSNYIRISVGKSEDMVKLLEELKKICSS